MIDFKNFKIKRGPSKDLHDPRLIVEEGYWYLSTDKAELFIGIVNEEGIPVLKPINSDLIPEINLEGYATEEFVREAIENIDIPEVELYDDTELRNLISTKADKEHSHEEYLKEIPVEYITEDELNSKGYLTEHQSLTGYATETYVLTEIAKAALEGNDVDLSGYATKDDLTTKADITYVDEKVAGIKIPEIPEVDLSNYYTKAETYSKEEVNALLPVEEIKEVKTKVETVLVPKVEQEIEPAIDDLKLWVENKEYLQDVDLEGYATKEEISYLAKKEHTHEQYLIKNELNEVSLDGDAGNSTSFYPGCVKIYSDSTKLILDANNNEFTINENNIATETKVLELIAANTVVADNKIGIDFTTDLTIGHLAAGTEIKADMTIGDILRRILCNPCDHEWIEATCTTLKTCKLCGITEGEALGHIEEIIPAKAATCEEAGLTEGKKCSRCGDTLVEQQIIPALGHNYTSEVTKPATCVETGIKTFTCTKCGDTYEEVIPMLEHKQATREENRVEPDCTNSGSYDTVTYCTECNEELSRETTTIPALGHNMIVDEAKDPTCTETGLTEGSHCSRCDYKVEQEVIEALGHDYGEWVITKQPEVGVPGEQQKTCKRCEDVIIEEIPALEPEEPEIPEGIIGEIITKELPMYSVDYDGNVTAKDFEVVTFNSREEANQAPVESCFYQVKDENGEIIESGYQDMQIANDEMYYVIALPKSVDYNSNMVRMQAYDDEEQLWADSTKLPLTSDPEIVAACCDEVGIDISHINTDLYTVWVNNEDICTGSRLRYIIEE